MIFDMWNSEKIWHESLTDCPPRLSDVATVPWEIQRSHFHQYYSDILLIIYVTSQEMIRKQSIIHLPTPPENVTTLTCELQNFFIWLKVCCVLSDVGGFERASCGLSSVALKRTRCDVWQLECQASSATASVQSDHYLQLIHASSLFRHCSATWYTTLCWNSAHAVSLN